MGLFDSVYANCPNCGRRNEFQSKAGECYMHGYTLEDAPVEVAWDVLNQPTFCHGCRRWFALIDPDHPPGVRPRPNVRTALLKPNVVPETREQLNSGRYWWPYDMEFSFDLLAQGTEARRAETGTGSVHDGPVAKPCAQGSTP